MKELIPRASNKGKESKSSWIPSPMKTLITNIIFFILQSPIIFYFILKEIEIISWSLCWQLTKDKKGKLLPTWSTISLFLLEKIKNNRKGKIENKIQIF